MVVFFLVMFRERTETIDVIFSSSEHKATWAKSFLEAKKALCKLIFKFKNNFLFSWLVEVAAGRRNISFQHVLTLPHSRSGSQVCYQKKTNKILSINNLLVFLWCTSFIIR